MWLSNFYNTRLPGVNFKKLLLCTNKLFEIQIQKTSKIKSIVRQVHRGSAICSGPNCSRSVCAPLSKIFRCCYAHCSSSLVLRKARLPKHCWILRILLLMWMFDLYFKYQRLLNKNVCFIKKKTTFIHLFLLSWIHTHIMYYIYTYI